MRPLLCINVYSLLFMVLLTMLCFICILCFVYYVYLLYLYGTNLTGPNTKFDVGNSALAPPTKEKITRDEFGRQGSCSARCRLRFVSNTKFIALNTLAASGPQCDIGISMTEVAKILAPKKNEFEFEYDNAVLIDAFILSNTPCKILYGNTLSQYNGG